ncbi:FUSC family protein [Halalkalibacter urbisdiaboli]|uniref:FUSC family protein n=1 Tax=Halalkalibacter urbisdiaboli TaxID=1960589 RepID=UPI000B44DAD3|nr:aromatic acid exporter family protein [Halalkalibacter urbisdiaboli]
MAKLKKYKLFGGRIVKTGIAVLFTTSFCYLLGLPMVFAAIIAIVTIEPTAADSIKKGIVRFPAALIGASLSMTFTYFFGHTPLTFTLAAVTTIFVCIKLKLEAGALIATLTAIMMIPVTHDYYFLAFIERTSTTIIGLIVSTLVNLLILPAKFSEQIKQRNERLYTETAHLFMLRCGELLKNNKCISKQTQDKHRYLTNELKKSFQLCHYQRDEWKFHRHSTGEMRDYFYEYKKLECLQQIHYYLGNLFSITKEIQLFNKQEREMIMKIVESVVKVMKDPAHRMSPEYLREVRDLDELFWHTNESVHKELTKKYHHHFTPSTIILFVVLSIHDVLEELEHLARHQIERGRL